MVKIDNLTAHPGTGPAALLLGASLCLAMALPANAEKVGVAAAVNPDAFSSLSGVPNKQLNIGKSIFYSERIKTTTSGFVQVLLVDGSTFTVGPNSDLVIDKFVYDPNKKTGEMVATFSKGTMRFIGGKLSKNAGGVRVNTPSGSLAIRGGMFQGNATRGIYSFLYGHSLTFKGRNGQVQTVYQPGYTLDLSRGLANVRPTTAEDTNDFQQAFSGGGTVAAIGQSDQNNNNQPPPLTETISLQDLISDATQTAIDSTIVKEEQQQADNTAPPDPAPDNTPPDTTPPEPEIISVELRVLTPPGQYTAYGNPVESPEDRNILGGDDNPAVTADDFIWTFDIVDGRLVGTVTDLVEGVGPDGQPELIEPASVDFPAVLECTSIGICPVTEATITSNGETKSYQGLAALREGFFAYHLASSDGGPGNESDLPDVVLAFGGEAHDFGTPSGRTFGFALTPDVAANAAAPFASPDSMPLVDTTIDEQTGQFVKPQPFVTPLLYKETDGTPSSEAVWLQTSLYINTTPRDDQTETEFSQESFVNVALGGVENGGLVGARRGGSHFADQGYDGGSGCEVDCTGDVNGTGGRSKAYTFTGDIASLDGPDGSHFLGSEQPNIVIGFDSTGEAHNIGRDQPYEPGDSESVGSTYHVGAGLGTLEPQTQSFDGTFNGYATGMVESEIPASDFTNVVASRSSDDFSITFNPDANTLWADLTVFDDGGGDVVDSYQLGFGDKDQDGTDNRSAYIDDLHYAAIENGAVVTRSDYYPEEYLQGEPIPGQEVSTPYEYAEATSYLVSGDQLGVTQFFPETFEADENGNRPFCNDCDFIKWGAWGTRTEFGDSEETVEYVDNVHLGWWVAGDITKAAELDDLANLGMIATYNGNAIGNVANRIGRDSWATYVASGKLFMDWDFAERAGNFEISKFDKANIGGQGLTFAGPISQPGNLGNHFAGNISGNLPNNLGGLSGAAKGSFVNDLNGNSARGVIGNWNVKGNNYKATGIFAGSGHPGVRP